ncbi:MAG TPA: histidinol-phosphate transaminase [Spirochaetota bacterium]|nr:histidinol-phosphate transaminase [Spirochaetota bacterium]HPI90021.1 histidinol-phosphate transaminase [Spirochaetota bacterium]HPR48097.1 histidinol-phosphate transaminase [Spirochaetota bacterium]
MKFWNSRLKNTEEYVPGEQPENLDEYIKLNTNENPFPPSKPVLDALRTACNESLKRYPDPVATEVREIFARQNNLSVKNVFVGNGSDEIFTLIFRGFIEPEGTVGFPYPSYALYYTLAQVNGISYEKVPLNDDFTYDMKAFLKKKYDLVIMANPNNPTGTWCELAEIEAFLKNFKGLLVVDEAYVDFYNNTAIELVKKYDNVIVTRSFSKSYSLAGMRIGIAAASEEIIRGFMVIKDSYNVNRLSLVAAKAALLDQKGFKYNIQMVINNKEYLEERLEALGFIIIPSQANFIFVRHPGINSGELYERLKEQKILVRHYRGPVQSDYIRISIGTMMEIKTVCSVIESITGP